MKAISQIKDGRIDAWNFLLEISIDDYLNLVNDVIDKNDFQRKRVRSSKTVYALLKEDLKLGCIIPPLVIALSNTATTDLNMGNISSYVIENKKDLLILDGLQRTLTIKDLLNELSEDSIALDKVKNHKIRLELYVGINRLSILYRMLTLNTGQTPMTLRQQIEMLYMDYLEQQKISHVSLIRETESRTARKFGEYNFHEIIDGFNAYLDREPSPMVRSDILDNIKSLEKLSKENQNIDLFESYIQAYHKLLEKILNLSPEDVTLPDEYIEKNDVFDKTAYRIFRKPQVMSGFGAALGKLIDFEMIENIDSIISLIDKLKIGDAHEFLEKINRYLAEIKQKSKKIGTSQREFFLIYFRILFNRETDSYLNLTDTCEVAYQKYASENF
ncbi:hypothetical protein A6J88_03830 [Neisseria mucosa]|uniref:GmrSD restriction endonucleases N-terminal domain-containing protein n=1 Tax=Neisseria mucosa TaxID=488 RepID=A0ABM6JAK3_NEIMU|nr:DUF262 domain-containing protein [Neisseria mucosa]ARC50506.1 hypothetical protein A6J88_03830 [Neisseria mucosa]